MDMTSIVTSHPALADGEAGLEGSREPVPATAGALKLAPASL